MRFLANENFPGEVVHRLRRDGHDVVWMREEGPGTIDEDVLAKAESESRILLTFDKDFGELAFRARLSSSCGIVLFRLTMSPPEEAMKRIVEILLSRERWDGVFSVISDDKIRVRSLPQM